MQYSDPIFVAIFIFSWELAILQLGSPKSEKVVF